MKTTKTKTFDAVAESRRWKQAVSRQTEGMTRAELLTFFNNARTTQPRGETEQTCILREGPPKP